jgi:hypothetical protein
VVLTEREGAGEASICHSRITANSSTPSSTPARGMD